jgi:hypothetical protein
VLDSSVKCPAVIFVHVLVSGVADTEHLVTLMPSCSGTARERSVAEYGSGLATRSRGHDPGGRCNAMFGKSAG